MPWRETCPVEQRLEFVREYETELFTMTELAAQYGISRKTAYKWLAAYAASGALGLGDRSRRPHRSRGAGPIRALLPALGDRMVSVAPSAGTWT